MNRQKMFLFILVIMLIAAAVYAYLRMPRQKTVDKLKYAPGRSVESVKNAPLKQDEGKLHLAVLDEPLTSFRGFRRNIFWLPPIANKLKLPPPPPPPPLPPPPLSPLPPPPPPTVAQLEEDRAKAEMAKFVFLGFLKKDGKKTIFVAKDKEIFVVKKGDKIANRYEVTNITDEVMTITSMSGYGQLIIPLIDNSPLLMHK